jgi:hypothetical protein
MKKCQTVTFKAMCHLLKSRFSSMRKHKYDLCGAGALALNHNLGFSTRTTTVDVTAIHTS